MELGIRLENPAYCLSVHGRKFTRPVMCLDKKPGRILLTRLGHSRSTVMCVSDVCRLHEMAGEDFLAVINSSPRLASTMKDICRNRLFKRAVKKYALEKTRGLSNDDLVAAFHDADIDHSGTLSLDEVTRLMRKMDPQFPETEIRALLEFVDVDEDGNISLPEFKRIFHVFDKEEDKDDKGRRHSRYKDYD